MKQRSETIRIILLYFVLIIITFFFLFPIFWLIVSSLKANSEILKHPFGLPKKIYLENYSNAWRDARLSRYFLNTVIVTSTSVISLLIISSLSANALARYKFTLRNFMVMFFLAGLMFPPQAALLPLFRKLVRIGIIDSYFALILPYISFGLPFTIFLFRGYFLSFPVEIEDSARTDGCTKYMIFWRILLPNSKSAIAAASIFNIIWLWNEFLFAYCFINKEEIKTISIGLMSFQSMYSINFSGLYAAISIATIPTVLIFLFFERYFEEALVGALKS